MAQPIWHNQHEMHNLSINYLESNIDKTMAYYRFELTDSLLAYIHIYSTQYTVQSTQYKVYSTKYKVHSTKYTVHSTKYTVQSTQYKVHSIQYTVYSTQYTVHTV